MHQRGEPSERQHGDLELGCTASSTKNKLIRETVGGREAVSGFQLAAGKSVHGRKLMGTLAHSSMRVWNVSINRVIYILPSDRKERKDGGFLHMCFITTFRSK